MKRSITLLIIMLAGGVIGRASEIEKVIELKRLVDENEPKQKWKKIHWQADADSALKAAQAQNKPILVFMLVNESGKKDAEHC